MPAIGNPKPAARSGLLAFALAVSLSLPSPAAFGANEEAPLPPPSAPPKMMSPRQIEGFNCDRYFLHKGRTYTCDSDVRHDGEILRPILDEVPAAVAEHNARPPGSPAEQREMASLDAQVADGFAEVMRGCADPSREHGWIDDAFVDALGHALVRLDLGRRRLARPVAIHVGHGLHAASAREPIVARARGREEARR